MTLLMPKYECMINLRITHSMYEDLQKLGNYAEYIRNLILNDQIAQGDEKVIDQKIEEHQKAIKKLKSLA